MGYKPKQVSKLDSKGQAMKNEDGNFILVNERGARHARHS
jgi:hypothetical protein